MWKQLLETNIFKQEACDLKAIAESARYFQLATLNVLDTGEYVPSCRTVCFRKFIGDRWMAFSVDKRSRKVEHEFKQSQNVEVCCYFPLAKQQFRLRGVMFLISNPSEESQLVPPSLPDIQVDWQKERLLLYQEHISNHMRASFAWECHPGHYRDRHLEFLSRQDSIEYRLHGEFTQPFLPQLRDYTKVTNHVFVSEEESVCEMTYHNRAMENFVMLVVRIDCVDHLNLDQFPFERQFYQICDKNNVSHFDVIDLYP
jgi:hypothetical protein